MEADNMTPKEKAVSGDTDAPECCNDGADAEIFGKILKNLAAYHPSGDFAMVRRAYELARTAHDGQKRKSGEPYIIHPLCVALILTELQLDMESVCAGILHDVIEDTAYSREDITRIFGEEVALIVDGVTKLDKIEYMSIEEEQANNYRKMFLSMAEDIRVILIKIADRLHNLRTLNYMSPEKQKEKSQETLDIYAPLAHRLGIAKIRYEMEDLSFKYLNREAFDDLNKQIKKKQFERENYVRHIVTNIREKLEENGIKATVEGRPKHFFSIYKKMHRHDKSLDQIFDLFAVRIIVDDIKDCYAALGVVHELYLPIPDRFKDYIALPKKSGYRSIHNTLSDGPEQFEVQIRTYEMHKEAEYGIAAHWKYKSGQSGVVDGDKEEAKYAWLREILNWSREYADNAEYLENLKHDLDIFQSEIFCFTPKGKLIQIQSGATVIDFAYLIHTAVGNRMAGAKVNGKIVQINHVLENGDLVEIMTSQNRSPSMDWLKIVKTSQARTKINQWFKSENREANILHGKDLLEKAAKVKSLTLSELLVPKYLEVVLDRYSMRDWDSVCASVGHGALKEGQIVNRLYDEYLAEHGSSIPKADLAKHLIEMQAEDSFDVERAQSKNKNQSGVVVKDVGDIAVRFSKCCSPVPGDEIIGFITRGRGVTIHRTDCINVINLPSSDKMRLLEATWRKREGEFRADIRVTTYDEIGMLEKIAVSLAAERINVKALNVRTNQKADAVFDISIMVKTKEELDFIMSKIKSLPRVYDVERITS